MTYPQTTVDQQSEKRGRKEVDSESCSLLILPTIYQYTGPTGRTSLTTMIIERFNDKETMNNTYFTPYID